MKRFNENLKVARELTGMTRQALAKRLNITPQAYGKYEKGLREPNIETLCRISDVLQVSLDALVGNKKPRQSEYDRYAEYLRNLGFEVSMISENNADAVCVRSGEHTVMYPTNDAFCTFIRDTLNEIEKDLAHRREESMRASIMKYMQAWELFKKQQG